MDTLSRKTLTTSRSLQYTYYTSTPTGDTKTKPALLFCHGFPDSSFLWNDVISHLSNSGVLADRKVIVPDMLGYGGTSKPLETALYSYSGMADDLIEILEAENVRTVTVIGHDWGAGMAQRLYGFHADRVDKIVLLNIAYFPPAKHGDPRFTLEAANKMFEDRFNAPLWTYWEFFTSEDGPRLMRAWRAYVTGDQSVPLKPYAQEKRWRDSFFEQFERDGFEAPVQWYKATTQSVQYEAELNIPSERHRVDVPLLFVGCTKDGNNRIDFIDMPQKMGLLPHLQLKLLHCGHWSPMEKPKEVAGFIQEFLDQ